jgi:hypothetical protein
LHSTARRNDKLAVTILQVYFNCGLNQAAGFTERKRHSRKASHVGVAVLSSSAVFNKGPKSLAGLP